jgi:hypothetical protein
MIFWFLLSFLAPFSAAYVFTRWVFAESNNFQSLRFLLVILASGLGLGVASCTFFLCRVFNVSTGAFQIIETLFFLVCTAIFLLLNRRESNKRKSDVSSSYRSEPASPGISKIISVSFFIVIFSAVIAFVTLSINRPHGVWDAHAIWNLHARFLFRGGSHWADYFSPFLEWSHPSYPLLLPATVARFWTYIGNEATLVPQILAGVFTFGTVGLVLSAFFVLQAKSRGMLAAVLLLGTGSFMDLGSTQYADVPLGFFILSTTIVLTLKDQISNNNNRFVVLAGMMCALAAWTKNEGFLFLVAVLMSRVAVTLLTSGQMRRCLKEMIFFSLGFIPIIMVTVFFKLNCAPQGDLLSSQPTAVLMPKLVDTGRYLRVAKAFRGQIHKDFRIMLMAILFVYLFLFRIEVNAVNKRILLAIGTILATMVFGYFFIYIVTPYDLNFHLTWSLSRLFLQLWPAFLFLVFFMTKPLSDRECME